MTYLFVFNWGWMVGAALIGFGMGWIAVVRRSDGLSRMALRRIGLALAVLLVISLTHVLPGRFGYGLDLGLVMFAVYLLGCALGSWLRFKVVSRSAAAD
ncbi:MAG: hypothetical protein EKK40_07440 [Bradyrhizobiaceae bacterium]|nr:MAG: hypothetical protein EKK40_07440 [Bradyrhizobiaceae bacterium]